MQQILYLSAMFPLPATNGGKQGLLNNILQLFHSDKCECDFLFADIRESLTDDSFFKEIGLEYSFFELKEQSFFSGGIISKIKILNDNFFSEYPRSLIISGSSKAHEKINNIINTKKVDLIIIDGIMSFGMLPEYIAKMILQGKKNKTYPKIVYISHNIESDFNFHIFKSDHWFSYLKYAHLFEAIKTKKIEEKLFKNSDGVISVSYSDYQKIKSITNNKNLFYCPHPLKKREQKWKYTGSNKLFFTVAPEFPPNKEAIRWICKVLAPKLLLKNENIEIFIAGADKSQIPASWLSKNVKFLGFVSDEELANLHCTCDLYICPIIYGSGVKMKVLDALSYGMPVAATANSLEGFDFTKIEPLIFRENLDLTVKNILNLLQNKEKQEEMNGKILQDVNNFIISRKGIVDFISVSWNSL